MRWETVSTTSEAASPEDAAASEAASGLVSVNVSVYRAGSSADHGLIPESSPEDIRVRPCCRAVDCHTTAPASSVRTARTSPCSSGSATAASMLSEPAPAKWS